MVRSTPRRRAPHRFLYLVLGVFVVVAAVVAFMVIRQYKSSGEWKLPTAQSMVQIKDSLLPQSGPSRVIYLHRGAIDLRGGDDDAANNVSSIVRRGEVDSVRLPGFTGSNRQWKSIVQCTSKLFAPYDVVVTEALPVTDDYILVAVGGKAQALKQKQHSHSSGLAPFIPKTPIPGAVVFAFSASLRNNPQYICETIGMEVGHAYGLDHGYNCKDVMTYLKRCGKRSFTDKDVPCGEHEKRECAGGDETQNPHQHLLKLLGPAAS